MKLAQDDSFLDGNIGESESFTIEASPKAFKILSSSLYSHSKRAIIRELSCNAYDSHKLAGHPEKPFDITLPNKVTPYLEIRDYGVGLSHSDIMSLYINFFESTKTGSNDFIGALGLGSKSPFSYSDSFTVTSYFDGTANSYLVFKGKKGIPNVNRVSSVETDEPTGLRVKIPVNSDDYGKFANEAENVFKFFDTKPNFIGQSVDCSIEYPFKIDGVGAVDGGYGYAYYAVQGNVCYRIDEGIIPDSEKRVFNGNVYLYFDIGDIHPTPSREELDYDEGDTVKNIANKIKELNDSFQSVIDERLSKCDTTYAAVKESRAVIGLLSSNSRGAIKRFSFNYKGIDISPFIIDGLKLRLKSNYFYSATNMYSTMSIKLKSRTNYITFGESAFFLVDDKKQFRRRVREYCIENDIYIDQVVLIQNTTSSSDAFSKLLLGAKVIKVSDLPEIKLNYSNTRKRGSTSDVNVYDLHLDETEVDFKDVEYYAEINRWEIEGEFDRSDIKVFAKEKDIDVFLIKRKNIKKVSAHAINVVDLIADETMTDDEVESYARYLDYYVSKKFHDLDLFSEFKESYEYYESLSQDKLSYDRIRYSNTDKEGMNTSPFNKIKSEYMILSMFDSLAYSVLQDRFIDYVKEILKKETENEE